MHSLGYFLQSVMQRNLSQLIHPMGFELKTKRNAVEDKQTFSKANIHTGLNPNPLSNALVVAITTRKNTKTFILS